MPPKTDSALCLLIDTKNVFRGPVYDADVGKAVPWIDRAKLAKAYPDVFVDE
jgi:hypothetical protein